MKTLKKIVFQNFVALFAVLFSSLISLALLTVRLKTTYSFFYLFLAWNLCLAWVPFVLTLYLSGKKKSSQGSFWFYFFIWLLFLPNAPYIVTDYKHLRLSDPNIVLFDAFMIGAFAVTGLLLYVLSLKQMKNILIHFTTQKVAQWIVFLIPFLCGFGVYLGRSLRWNSWDLLFNPHYVFRDLLEIVSSPFQHYRVWGYTLFFGVFLWMLFVTVGEKIINKKRFSIFR
ncbi:MAG: DUF1361 domain-containing protein [Flavobacteriaceae bacterium]